MNQSFNNIVGMTYRRVAVIKRLAEGKGLTVSLDINPTNFRVWIWEKVTLADVFTRTVYDQDAVADYLRDCYAAVTRFIATAKERKIAELRAKLAELENA